MASNPRGGRDESNPYLSYFVHDEEYVGVSAFVNEPAEESERNALMLAVGALVRSTVRLGKSWRHAVGLREMAK